MRSQVREAAPPAARVPLTRRRVLTTALRSVDEHGLEALTMHNLAGELGSSDMSLYNHVRSKDDLLAGIHSLVWEEIAASVPKDADDPTWLRGLGNAILDTGRRHPNAMTTVIVGSGVFPPPMLEIIASQFARGGTPEPDPQLVNGIATVTAFALGWAACGALPNGPCAVDRVAENERQRILRVTRALPLDTPDRLVDAAITVCAHDVDALFASGLDAVIAGCGYGDPSARDSHPLRSSARGMRDETREKSQTGR